MATTFRGTHEPKLDGKGRISIPSPFRRVLAGGMEGEAGLPQVTIVYGRHLKGRVEAFSLAGMSALEAAIQGMPEGPDKRRTKTWVVGESETFTLDDTGRIVLPAKIKAKIGLPDGGPVTMVGMLDKFEIWSTDRYRAERGDADEAAADDLPDDIETEQLIARLAGA